MKRKIVIFVTITLSFTLVGCTLDPRETSNDTVNTSAAATCLAERTISSQQQLTTWSWDGYFQAVAFENNAAYPDLAKYELDGQGLLLWNEATGTIGVNEKYFSDLHFADATALTEKTSIGTLKDTSLSTDELQSVTLFLLDTLIIRTYAHLDADVCLARETDTTENYEAYFTAVHRYCTNTCDETSYDFTVAIDKTTGQITVY